MSAALVALLAAVVVMGVTAAISRRLDRVAVVDVAWGLVFVAIAVVLAVLVPDAHSWLLALLVTACGRRLWRYRPAHAIRIDVAFQGELRCRAVHPSGSELVTDARSALIGAGDTCPVRRSLSEAIEVHTTWASAAD